MKKLKLRLQDIGGAEVLTREQLKSISGGHGESCTTHYDCPSGHLCVITSLGGICCNRDDMRGSGDYHPACRSY